MGDKVFKFENVEVVTAKKEFEASEYNINGEYIGQVIIPKGYDGVIESIGESSTNDLKVSYYICFEEEKNEVRVSVYEDEMELYLDMQ